jgi:2-methylisocitrate lyase-like PEP mutase family enzyme
MSTQDTISPAQKLRNLLAGEKTLMVPCCYDGISARLICDAGFKLTVMSGFETAAMTFGLPDTGYLTLTDLVDQMRRISRAVPGFPVIVDGETGYGNAVNVRYTVIEHARAGAAAVMIEDQEWPRRCPFLEGSRVISRKEARMKIRAAVEAAKEVGILILARTDARASLGFQAALERCQDFQEEGADMIVAEALESTQEMQDFCAAMKIPTITNAHPGLTLPFLQSEKYQEMGFKLVAYHPMMLTATRAMQEALESLASKGNYDGAPPMVAHREMANIVGFEEYLLLEERYRAGN